MSERGSVSVVMLAIALVVALLGAALTGVAQVISARAAAVAAADAAALAAAPLTFRPFGSALTPAAEAARYAAANGGRLVRCECPVDRSWEPRTVTVVVEVEVDAVLFGRRRVQAQSRAELRPVELVVPRVVP